MMSLANRGALERIDSKNRWCLLAMNRSHSHAHNRDSEASKKKHGDSRRWNILAGSIAPWITKKLRLLFSNQMGNMMMRFLKNDSIFL
jgi:hypothetical protein